jgi:hypothetical protein
MKLSHDVKIAHIWLWAKDLEQSIKQTQWTSTKDSKQGKHTWAETCDDFLDKKVFWYLEHRIYPDFYNGVGFMDM